MLEVCSSTVSICLAFYLSWKLTLVVIMTLPVVTAVYLISIPLSPAIKTQKQALSIAFKYANISMGVNEIFKTCNGQQTQIWLYLSALKKVASSYTVQAGFYALQFGITKLLMVGIFIQGFWFGAHLVDQGMDPGRVLTTFYACLATMLSIETLLPQWLLLAKGVCARQALQLIQTRLEYRKKAKI